jgi:hypothetical protein
MDNNPDIGECDSMADAVNKLQRQATHLEKQLEEAIKENKIMYKALRQIYMSDIMGYICESYPVIAKKALDRVMDL